MKKRSDPATYKSLIDGLVALRPSVLANRARAGVWHRQPPPDQVKFNELLAGLSKQQRDLVAEIVQQAADGAVHDALVYMTDRGYGFTHGGAPLPESPFDTEIYFDYMARIAGTSWPDDHAPGPQDPPKPKTKPGTERRKGDKPRGRDDA
mgnify:CR=1 FL=1